MTLGLKATRVLSNQLLTRVTSNTVKNIKMSGEYTTRQVGVSFFN